MWQATLNNKYPVPEAAAYVNRRGFRASQLDGYALSYIEGVESCQPVTSQINK